MANKDALIAARLLHIDMPQSRPVLQSYISELVQYLESNPKCVLHSGEDFVSDILLILWNEEEKEIDSIKRTIAAQIERCVQCIDALYNVVLKGVNRIKEFADNVKVDSMANQHIAKFKNNESDQMLKESKKQSLFILYEILSYPDSLSNEAVNQIFCEFLLVSQKIAPLKMADQSFPGFFILAASPNSDVRAWAKKTVKQSKSTLTIPQWNTLEISLDPLLNYASQFTRDAAGSHLFTNTSVDVFSAVELILSKSDGPVRQDILRKYPELLQTIGSWIKSDVSTEFWELFRCFCFFFRAGRDIVLKDRTFFRDVVIAIITSTTYNSVLSKFRIKHHDEAAKAANIKHLTLIFFVVDYILRSGPNVFGSVWNNYVELIGDSISSWSPDARKYFEDNTIEGMKKTKWFMDSSESVKSQLLNITANKTSANVEFSADSLVSVTQFLPLSFEVLDAAFSSLFLSPGEEIDASKFDKDVLQNILQVWNSIRSPNLGDHLLSVSETAFKTYARIVHFEHFKINEAADDSQKESLRLSVEAMNTIRNSISSLLISVKEKESDVLNLVGPDFLFVLLSGSQKVVDPANKLILSGSKSTSVVSAFTSIFLKSPKNFATTVTSILDVFTLVSSAKCVLLKFARSVLNLLSSVVSIAFAVNDPKSSGDHLEILRSEIQQSIWIFFANLLTSLKRWAKMSKGMRETLQDISALATHTFNLTKMILLNMVDDFSKGLSTTFPEKHLIAAFYASASWMNSLDESLRQSAVDSIVLFVEVITAAKLVSDQSSKAFNHVINLCENRPGLQLTDDQRIRIVSSISMYESKVLVGVSDERMEVVDDSNEIDLTTVSEAEEKQAPAVVKKTISPENWFPTSSKQTPSIPIPIKRTTGFKKPAVSSTAGKSKLQQLRGEVNNDARSKGLLKPALIQKPVAIDHNAPQRTGALFPGKPFKSDVVPSISAEGSDDEDEDGGIAALVAENQKNTRSRTRVPQRQTMRDDSTPITSLFKNRGTNGSNANNSNEIVKPKPVRDMTHLYRHILTWECEPGKVLEGDTPPGFDLALKTIPTKFSSAVEYADIIEPLLLVECWQQFVRACSESTEQELVFQLCQVDGINDFHDLRFTTATKEIRDRKITERDILNIYPVDSTTVYFLGQVTQIQYQGETSNLVCRIHIGTRFSTIVPTLQPSTQFLARRMFQLTTVNREYAALINVPMIPLCPEILNPSIVRPYIPENRVILETQRRLKVNKPQAKAIATAVGQKTGFVLIQGPPGTGKTKTILGLIGSFLVAGGSAGGSAIITPSNEGFGKKSSTTTVSKKMDVMRGRVLVCAPSNAACDEIVRRLKKGSFDWLGGKSVSLKIVRVGSGDSIHPDVRDVSLESLVEEALLGLQYNSLLKDGTEEKVKDLRMKINNLTAERDRLRESRSAIEQSMNDEKSSKDVMEKLNNIELQIRDVVDKRSELFKLLQVEQSKSKDFGRKLDDAKFNAKMTIMKEANVVLCTLNSAGSDALASLENLEFPIVIVDEACQSIEISSVIPLRYGAKKCIMVGDPNQLPPTVLSKHAQGYAYERSLFQRVMLEKPQSVQLLNIQYRMHPEISRLPSLLFYDKKLEDAPGLDKVCEAPWHLNPLLSPYRLFDVDGKEEMGQSYSIFNPQEVEACVQLVEMLCNLHPEINFGTKIGVITPYKLQSKKIKQRLSDRFGPKVLDYIDVNTVDGFQGQEKDIIILSCVRANKDAGIGFLIDLRPM
ncbi:DEAD-box type RNA helicase, partial [Nowakowskiella sp. JEL0407]